MKMPSRIQNVLLIQGIKLDTAKDYSVEELNALYEKVIYFLNRRISKVTMQESKFEPCTANLEKLSQLIPREFDVLGYDGLLSKYTKEYLTTLHRDERYTIAEAISLLCRENGIKLDALWSNLIANYGVLTSGA